MLSIFWLLLISAGLMTALVRLIALRERWTVWSWLIVFLASTLVLGGLWMLIQGANGSAVAASLPGGVGEGAGRQNISGFSVDLEARSRHFFATRGAYG